MEKRSIRSALKASHIQVDFYQLRRRPCRSEAFIYWEKVGLCTMQNVLVFLIANLVR